MQKFTCQSWKGGVGSGKGICKTGLSLHLLVLCTKNCWFSSLLCQTKLWISASENIECFSSVQVSRSVVFHSLRPHESQHARPPCPSPILRVHSDSHPSSQWFHPAISSSVVPFCSCPQPLPASESFPMSQLFAWGGQSTWDSASASFPPKKSQGLQFHVKNSIMILP